MAGAPAPVLVENKEADKILCIADLEAAGNAKMGKTATGTVNSSSCKPSFFFFFFFKKKRDPLK